MSGFQEHKVAFIGFGEAASAFVQGWNVTPSVVVKAFDIKTDSEDAIVRAAKIADYDHSGVQGCENLAEALQGADVVFSLVTADQAGEVAKKAATFLEDGAFFFDCNSCAPGTKRRNAEIVDGAGARYVDVAVMSPVYPKLHHSPVSLSGDYAKDAEAVFVSFDMKPSIVDGGVGSASSIKMIRSVMMKGMEALFAECVLAGRVAGVDDVVLESLDKTYPGFDFKAKASYMLERSMSHGVRRAAEMREVALTVDELGLDGDMARATVEWQQRIGDLKVKTCEGEGYQARADSLLNAFNMSADKKDC